MLRKQLLLVEIAVCLVAVDQLSWWVDLGGYFLNGKFPLGVAKYVVAKDLPLTVFYTSFHHLWFLPLCMHHLYTYNGSLSMKSYLSSFAVSILLTSTARLLVPYKIKGKVVNINMSHTFHDDIEVDILHRYDHQGVKHLVWMGAFMYGVLQPGPCYLLSQSLEVSKRW